MSLNVQQDRAAAHVGSVLISAGAGTGKTRVLAERLIRTLERGVRPRQIVAVTFTEAAASELRSRVEAYLATRSANARAARDAHGYEAAQTLRDELPEATISTIHSLAARIAREHPEVSGSGLGFEVLDEMQGAGWVRAQLRSALHDLPPAVFGHLSAKKVFTLLETLLLSPDRALTALAQITTPAALLSQWQLWLEAAQLKAWHAGEQLRYDCFVTLLEHAPVNTDALESYRVAVLSALTNVDAPHLQRIALEGALHGFSRRVGSRANWGEEPYIAVREGLVELKKYLEQPIFGQRLADVDAALAQVLPHLRDAYLIALERLDTAKRLEAKLGFDDLLRSANRALESIEVREYYRERLRVLMIDEFQDTTPSQWRMLSRLVHDNLELTIVGDEKQSIYGFTGATPEVFRAAEALMLERGGLRVSLSDSYRSHAALVETINQSFGALFAGGQTQFEELSAVREANPAAPLEPVELHTVHGTRDDDARLVAKRIVALVKNRVMNDKTAPTYRTASYKDIAVLLRSFTDLECYTAQLEAHGVPFVVIGGRGLLARREVRDAIALLKFLENPADDHSLAIVLRGLWFALADDALLTLRLNAQTGSWWDALPATQPHAHAVLSELLLARADSSVDALLLKADLLTEFSVSLAALPDAARRLANLERFRAHLRSWQLSLPRLRDHLDDLEALEAELPEATPDSLDAVTIITIHKSKGLEYPIVLLPDLTRGSPPDASGYRLDPALGLAVVPDLSEYDAKPVLYFLIDDRAKRRELEERGRVLYVAATRAEDLLILSSQSTSRSDSAWELLIPHLPEAGVTRFTPDLSALQRRTFLPSPKFDARMADGSFELDHPQVPDRLPISSLMQYGRCPQRFAWQYLRGLEPLEREWLSSAAESSAAGAEERVYSRATIGSMVHAALERECRSHGDLEQLYQHTNDDVLREVWSLVSRAKLGQFAGLTAHTWQRELPISLTLHGIDLEGIVDAYQPALGWVLDYKTDGAMHPDHHLMRLALYAKHLGATRASLAYLRHDTLHEYSSADLQRGEALLQDVLTQIGAGKHAATPSSQNCQYCAFQRQCPEYRSNA